MSKNCLKDDNLYHCPCCDYINANYNNFKGHYRKMHNESRATPFLFVGYVTPTAKFQFSDYKKLTW